MRIFSGDTMLSRLKATACVSGLVLCLFLSGCQTGGGSVADKVLADFGLKEHPEGHVSRTDMAFEQLDLVGTTEMKRMNHAGRHGEIKFEGDGRRGNYYKQVKVYYAYQALDAKVATDAGSRNRGFTGTVQYRYRIYESERRPTQAEAATLTADRETSEEGREIYRYNFSSGGVWDGAAGEKTKG